MNQQVLHSKLTIFRRFCLSAIVLLSTYSFAQKNKGFTKEIMILVDNDALLFGETSDRYYSFGMGMDVSFKRKQFLGLQKLFPKKKNYFFNVQIKSEGYTPSYVFVDNFDSSNNEFDRPFAGLLYGKFNGVYVFSNTIFKSGLLLGVMGPSSFAKDIQWWYHTKIANEITFDGWEYQIPNQLIYNFDMSIMHGVTSTNQLFSLFGGLEGRLGNLYTELSPMIGFRLGKLDEFTQSIAMGNGVLSDKNRIHLYIQSEIKTTVIAFNGTAQGNLFRDDYPYRVEERLSRQHLTLTQSVYGAYKGLTLGFSYYYTQGKVLDFAKHHYGRAVLQYAW